MQATHLKLSLLGVLLVSLTSAYAESSVKSATPGFSVSLTALTLQPNADNLTYAVYTHPLPLTTPNWSQVTVKPGYSAAFDLGVKYQFSEAANSGNLDWLHFNSTNSDSFQAAGANSSVAPPYYFGPLAQALFGTTAYSQVKYDIDNVNLTLGHDVTLGSHIQMTPYAGLQGTYLKQEIHSNNQGTDSLASAYSITANNTSKFTGIGPRAGVNATYLVTNQFGISIGVGGSLLVGQVNSTTNFLSFGGGNHVPANTTLANQNLNKVIPEVDSKIEANYLFPLKGDGSDITVAVGYLFASYANSIVQVVPATLVPGAFNGGVIAIESSSQNTSNLNLNGPYASFVWKIS